MLFLTMLMSLGTAPTPGSESLGAHTSALTPVEASASPAAPSSISNDRAAGLPPADYEAPFPSEQLLLSEVLELALKDNINLRTNAVNVAVSEANVLAALGAYDVILSAGLTGTMARTPQRGSQFTISTGNRSIGANVGFSRKLETGGTISLRIDASRSQQFQPVNFLNASAGTTQLSSYRVAPTLTLNHPLLKGAGLKVNRADINKAKLAVTQAQAAQLDTAQNLVRDLVSAYWDVLFAHRDLLNKRSSVKLAKKQLERTQALVAAGRLSPVDAKAVEQAVAQREADLLNAEYSILDKSLLLRSLIGQNFVDEEVLGVVPTTDPLVRPRMVNIQDELTRALQQNPQIRQLELGIASGRIDELVAANQRLPQLDLAASVTPQGRSTDTVPDSTTGNPGKEGNWGEAFRNFFDDNGADPVFADWQGNITLTLTWDVQNRSAKGRHEAAKANIRKAELSLEQARQTVAASVLRAANSLRTTAKIIDVAQISMDLAQENLEAEQARFEVGRSTNYDVLLRLDELDRAQAAALSAQINYLKALAQLQALNSEILPAYGLDVP